MKRLIYTTKLDIQNLESFTISDTLWVPHLNGTRDDNEYNIDILKKDKINKEKLYERINKFIENNQSIDYIYNVNKLLETEKIQFQKNLYCVEDYKLGDSDDHIAPEYKKDFTKIFYNQL